MTFGILIHVPAPKIGGTDVTYPAVSRGAVHQQTLHPQPSQVRKRACINMRYTMPVPRYITRPPCCTYIQRVRPCWKEHSLHYDNSLRGCGGTSLPRWMAGRCGHYAGVVHCQNAGWLAKPPRPTPAAQRRLARHSPTYLSTIYLLPLSIYPHYLPCLQYFSRFKDHLATRA